MILKVRTHPITIYYVTGDDAYNAHEAAGDDREFSPCFITDSFGGDGFAWKTAEDFEESWAEGPGYEDVSFASYRRVTEQTQ